MQPFLKWPGGKRWLFTKYPNIFPAQYNVYYEPFLGGGSALFHLLPENAVISDINSELVNVYRIMAYHPMNLREVMVQHCENHNADYYYEVRDNIPRSNIERAARFLYLNRTCFNGMYRVNKQGDFNVPVGTRNCWIEKTEDLQEYSRILRRYRICSTDFVRIIHDAAENDLVFADPPYSIASNQSSFIKYNDQLFSWKDQKRLLSALSRARDRGASILATNTAYSQLEDMYRNNGFFVQTVNRFSSISGKSTGRKQQEELLISSYQIDL